MYKRFFEVNFYQPVPPKQDCGCNGRPPPWCPDLSVHSGGKGGKETSRGEVKGIRTLLLPTHKHAAAAAAAD